MTKAEVTDGIENTLLVAEVSEIDFPWAQSRSLSFDSFVESCSRFGVATDGERLVGFEGQWLLFADSKVYFVVRRIPEPIFRAMWTRNGDEGVTRKQLVREGYIEGYP